MPPCRGSGAVVDALTHLHDPIDFAGVDPMNQPASAAHIAQPSLDDGRPFILDYLVIAFGHLLHQTMTPIL